MQYIVKSFRNHVWNKHVFILIFQKVRRSWSVCKMNICLEEYNFLKNYSGRPAWPPHGTYFGNELQPTSTHVTKLKMMKRDQQALHDTCISKHWMYMSDVLVFELGWGEVVTVWGRVEWAGLPSASTPVTKLTIMSRDEHVLRSKNILKIFQNMFLKHINSILFFKNFADDNMLVFCGNEKHVSKNVILKTYSVRPAWPGQQQDFLKCFQLILGRKHIVWVRHYFVYLAGAGGRAWWGGRGGAGAKYKTNTKIEK